jgi:hypothetical protein
MKHRWTYRGALIEPGISDREDGKYARYSAVCSRCGEQRSVWIGVAIENLAPSGCPWPLRRSSYSTVRAEAHLRGVPQYKRFER